MLKSSIMGSEFINYRKRTMKSERKTFSDRVRSQGLGNIPIVIDSVDKEISDAIAIKERRYKIYGREFVFHMDKTVRDIINEVKILMLQNDAEYIFRDSNLRLGLEDGTIPDISTNLGTLYKKHRNSDDKILYLLVTREQTMYDFIKSIMNYILESVVSIFKTN